MKWNQLKGQHTIQSNTTSLNQEKEIKQNQSMKGLAVGDVVAWYDMMRWFSNTSLATRE